MKEKVFEAIKKSGKYGIRLRDIGHYCNCWHVMCLDYVHELVDEGKGFEDDRDAYIMDNHYISKSYKQIVTLDFPSMLTDFSLATE